MGQPGGNGAHVLVLEDDSTLSGLLRDVLSEEGYRVTLSPEPDLSPASVTALGADLIVLDLRFGEGADGVTFLERLKADSETAAIPVLVCSGDTLALKAMAERLEAWDCRTLTKPFGLDELLAATDELLVRAQELMARSAALRQRIGEVEDRLYDAIQRPDPGASGHL